MESREAQWLLVGGAARSGTTILMEILNTNPHIGLFAEFPLDKMLEWIGLYFGTEQVMNQFASKSTQNTRPWRPWPVRSLHFNELAMAPFRAVFQGKDLRVVGVKMPGIEARGAINNIEAHFPDVKIIQIVRNPIDTIASSIARRNETRLGRDAWYVSTIEQAISEWSRSWNAAILARKIRKARTLFIKYEDLENNFAGFKTAISKFLAVPPHFDALFSREHAARDLSPLDTKERELVEHRFGAIDRLWNETPLMQLLDRFPMLPLTFADYKFGECLRFSKGGNGLEYLAHGFAGPEDWGTWTVGTAAAIGLAAGAPPGECELAAKFRVFSRKEGSTASCIVKVNGAPIGTLSGTPKTWGEVFEVRLPVPAAALTSETIVIELEVSGERRVETESSGDTRPIGIGLTELTISNARAGRDKSAAS